MEKHGKDSCHGMPDMSHARRVFGGGLQEMDNREETNISGAPAEEGGMPGVRS